MKTEEREGGDPVICVLSQSSLEDTTDMVTDWLRAWGAPYIRINGGDMDGPGGPSFTVAKTGAKAQITIDGQPIDPESIKVVWYRRWDYNNQYRTMGLFADPAHSTSDNVYTAYSHLAGELRAASRFLFMMMESAEWLSRPSTTAPNKLRVLKLAADAGLDIPDTLLTSDREQVRDFIRKHGDAVVKPAGDTFTFTFGEQESYAVYTSVVSEDTLDNATWGGSFPSLFQEKLKKKYEIRSFYLDGEFFSMAMFTQQKSSTQVDFRKYSWRDPARTVPYSLPSEIEESLRVLMDSLSLETGSIDMVRTVDGRYVFLEVNPVGQFGMVSQPCNYHLERRVAAALVQRLNGTRKTP